MNPNGDYIPVETKTFRGLATTPNSTQIPPEYSPNLLNCVIREDGNVRRRAGYFQLGRRLVGQILAMAEFGALNEDPYFLVLTTHRQYYYDSTTEDFIDLTPGQQSYALTSVTLDHTFKISGDHTLDFLDGRIFPIVGGLNEGIYTVNGNATFAAGETTVIVDETLVSTTVTSSFAVVAEDWETPERAQIDFEDITDTNDPARRFIITNGSDRPRFWDGDTAHAFADWIPTSFTDFVTCKTLRVFAEHLMLGGVTATGVEPHTIAWSTAGDFEDFESGTSGVQILYQLTQILALEILGDRLVIYSDDAIMTGIFVDIPAVFAFEVVIPHGIRFVGINSLVSINVGHIYLSEQNIMLFDGSRGLRVLSDSIVTDYRVSKDQENLHLVASLNDFAKQTIYFVVPTQDDEYLDLNGDPGAVIYTLFYDVFNIGNAVWSREHYAHTPRAFGFFVNRAETLTWADASWEATDMPWSDEQGAWSEEAEQKLFPIRTFGDRDGNVFIITESRLSDAGNLVEQRYDTMDFSIPESYHSLYGRWGELEFEAFGSGVGVSFSTDQGQTFKDSTGNIEAEDGVTLTTSPTYYRIPIDFAGRTMRVKFSSAVAFALRWIRLWVRPGGPR